MHSRRSATSLLLLWMLIACGSPTENQAAAQTPKPTTAPPATALKPTLAKSKLSEATAAAKAWKPDAVLIQIAGRNIADDGLTLLWEYGFYSRSAKNCLVVNVGRTTSQQESGGEICESPQLSEDFMDSDKAIAIARKNGITKPTATMVVSAAARGGNPLWSVMDDRGMNRGDVMLDIDGKTGAVVSKTTQP